MAERSRSPGVDRIKKHPRALRVTVKPRLARSLSLAWPSAQIRTCATNAYGSCFESKRQTVVLDIANKRDTHVNLGIKVGVSLAPPRRGGPRACPGPKPVPPLGFDYAQPPTPVAERSRSPGVDRYDKN